MTVDESDKTRSIPSRITAAVATGGVLQHLNSSIVTIAIVAMADRFGVGRMAWLIPAIYIATAVGAPLAGRLGSLVGPRRVYVGGLVLVALGSGLGPLSPTAGWLVAAYVLIGLGMAAHRPNAMTIIRDYGDHHGVKVRTPSCFSRRARRPWLP